MFTNKWLYAKIAKMKELENQAYFWQKMDTLYLSSDFVITNPKGTNVKDFPDLYYPVDYGHLKILRRDKEKEILCFKGDHGNSVDQVVVCANIIDKSIEVKLLIGCDEAEQFAILRFLNSLDLQKAILIGRTDETPQWAMSEE